MKISFTDLGRLIEVWAAWYSIGVDGWLFSDESTHTCSLELPDPAAHGSASAQPPYPSDSTLDALLLRALNEFGVQCSRLGVITFSRSATTEELPYAAEPLVALLHAEHAFFADKRLTLFSELRRDYGDFGSHTMTLDMTIQNGAVLIRRASFEMNNRRRGLKLDLWEPMTNALAAYEDIYEQGAALGHSFTDAPDAFARWEQETGEEMHENHASGPGASAASEQQSPQQRQASHRFVPVGLPFPCLSPAEASRLERLSNQVAPMRRAVADGGILISTHSLRELAALITFARFCEPIQAMQRV